MTAFQTLIRLLQMMILPQEWINLVLEFVWIVKKTLTDCISHDCDIYMDDVLVKGPRTTYNKEEVIPGVQQYMFEHLQKLDQILFNLEIAGLMIAPLKS